MTKTSVSTQEIMSSMNDLFLMSSPFTGYRISDCNRLQTSHFALSKPQVPPGIGHHIEKRDEPLLADVVDVPLGISHLVGDLLPH